MTIDQAIEILNNFGRYDEGTQLKDIKAAVRLGIEALKEEIRLRIDNPSYQNHRLPGETEE